MEWDGMVWDFVAFIKESITPAMRSLEWSFCFALMLSIAPTGRFCVIYTERSG